MRPSSSAFFAPRRFNLIDFHPSASCAATLTLPPLQTYDIALLLFALIFPAVELCSQDSGKEHMPLERRFLFLGTVTRRAQNELDAASPAATIPEAAEGESLVSTTVSDLFAHYTF